MEKNILDTIGNTPIVNLQNIVKLLDLNGNIFAKLEFYNPGLSKKDRIAKYIIEKAKSTGELKENQEVVEVTSGNTGIGLALVCNIYKHKFTAFISSAVSKERLIVLRKLGANVVIIGDDRNNGRFSGDSYDTLMAEATKYAKDKDAYFVRQFENKYNTEAQMEFAREIDNFFTTNNIQLTHFCDFAGTGGAISGVWHYYGGRIKCVLVEPESAPAFTEKKNIYGCHAIQGGGYGKYDLDLLKEEMLEDIVRVSDEDMRMGLDMLLNEESILGSYSSGANLFGAIKILQKYPKSNVCITICDSYLKYLTNENVVY